MADFNGIEEWRPVVGFEGWYEVSNHGQVRRALAHRDWRSQGAVLRPLHQSAGYVHAGLSKEGKQTVRTVHSLVMEAFVGPRPSGCCVDHKDGDRGNNWLTNLHYVSFRENLNPTYGSDHWVHTHPVGTRGGRLLEEGDVLAIRAAREQGVRVADLAEEYGVSTGTVRAIAARRRWAHLP